MSAKQVNLEQGSKEWLDWRRSGVGASETPILLEKSPYDTTVRDLFFVKSGLAEEDNHDDNYIFQRGHEAEADIRSALEKETGITLNPVCLQRDDIHLASLDGYDAGNTLMEAKLVGKKVLKEASKDKTIPEHHLIQVNKQMFVADLDNGYWCGTDGKDIVSIRLERDEDLIKSIVDADKEFWDMVKSGSPPPLTNKDALFLTDPDQVKLVERLKSLKKIKDEIEGQYKDVEKYLKEIATHPKVKCKGITISTIERAGSIDYGKVPEIKELSKDYLDLYRKKATTYKKITFGKGE